MFSLTKISTAVGLLAIVPSTVLAIQYQGYASTVSCSGDYFFCNDGGAVCCSLPTGYGYSAQFNSLPSGTQGQGYTGSTCSAFVFSVYGSGTKCWNGGGSRVSHLNWFHSPSGKRSLGASESTDCASASGFAYTDNTGAERIIKVPGAGQNATAAQVVADLRLKQDFDALAKYETL